MRRFWLRRPECWLRVVLILALSATGCSDAAGSGDGGLGDAEDSGDIDPCEAAAPLWQEIWQVHQIDTGLPGIAPDTNLMDVWGSAADDVYAVGFAGTILHFDGTNWTKMESNTETDLEGIWGYVRRDASGAVTRRDVFAVGADGTVLRYDGVAWQPQLVVNDPDPANPNPQPVRDTFHDVWGIPASGDDPLQNHPEVVAVGGNGLIARYDGAQNRFIEMRNREEFVTDDGVVRVSWVRWSPERLGGVFGTGSLSDPLFVAVGNSGTILERSGTSWTRVGDAQIINVDGAFLEHLNGVWGRGSWEIFAVGLEGTVLRRDSGGSWTVLTKGQNAWILDPIYLRGIWGFGQSYCGETPDGGEVPQNTSWAMFIGWDGTLLLAHDGIICGFPIQVGNRLEGIWGQAPRAEGERWVDGGTADGGIDCDPITVYISGVNGTLLQLFNTNGR